MVPLGAARAPTLEQLVLGDFHGLRRGYLYHLTLTCKLRVLQSIGAIRALLYRVLYSLGGCLLSASGTIVLFGSLAARLFLGFIFGLGSGGLDERGRLAPGCSVLVQFC